MDVRPFGPGDNVLLPSIDFRTSIVALYEDVELPTGPEIRPYSPDYARPAASDESWTSRTGEKNRSVSAPRTPIAPTRSVARSPIAPPRTPPRVEPSGAAPNSRKRRAAVTLPRRRIGVRCWRRLIWLTDQIAPPAPVMTCAVRRGASDGPARPARGTTRALIAHRHWPRITAGPVQEPPGAAGGPGAATGK